MNHHIPSSHTYFSQPHQNFRVESTSHHQARMIYHTQRQNLLSILSDLGELNESFFSIVSLKEICPSPNQIFLGDISKSLE